LITNGNIFLKGILFIFRQNKYKVELYVAFAGWMKTTDRCDAASARRHGDADEPRR